jgi:UDP-N-acetylglucosamine 2-epimerase (non-hydrolysing)
MMTGLDLARVQEGLRILSGEGNATSRRVFDYELPNVSDKIVRIIQSYVNYVNRVVWRKS